MWVGNECHCTFQFCPLGDRKYEFQPKGGVGRDPLTLGRYTQVERAVFQTSEMAEQSREPTKPLSTTTFHNANSH